MTICYQSIVEIWQITKEGGNRVRVDCDVKPTFLHGGGVENTAGERAVDFDDEPDGLPLRSKDLCAKGKKGDAQTDCRGRTVPETHNAPAS